MSIRPEDHELRGGQPGSIDLEKAERAEKLFGKTVKWFAYTLYVFLLPSFPVALSGAGAILQVMLVAVIFAVFILVLSGRDPLVQKLYVVNLSHLTAAALLMFSMIIIGWLRVFVPMGIMEVFVGLILIVSSAYMVELYKGRAAALGLFILTKMQNLNEKINGTE